MKTLKHKFSRTTTRRAVKSCAVAVGLLWGCSHSARAFSIMGPIFGPDSWQVPEIGYFIGGIDVGGPKNIGEEYRWNTPIIYYGFDSGFLEYFGSNGVRAIEQGIGILNALTNFSAYSTELSEFPLESQRINDRAQALSLLDLKSVALNLMLEEMGLSYPDRFAWTIRSRACGPCPFCLYAIIRRNFDPVSFEPTSYVNGVLLSYSIFEFCSPPPTADAVEFPVDPLAQEFTSVMSSSGFVGQDRGVLRFGAYVTGLSRDDVGGLRYLYRTNNVNWESSSFDSEFFATNPIPQLVLGSNLTLFAQQALTNDAAGLQALYPGLIITSSSNYFTTICTNIVTVSFTTGAPWSPAGAPQLTFITNGTFCSGQIQYVHNFANLYTFQFIGGHWVAVPTTDLSAVTRHAIETVQNISVQSTPFSIPGTLVTNITSRNYLTNIVTGEFFVLPTNLCSIAGITPLLTNILTTTNLIFTVTNTITGTNTTGGTNGSPSFTQTIIDYYTNHAFVVTEVNCAGTNVTLRQGMDRFKFVRANFDSLLGRFFEPITNVFRLVAVTNSRPVIETYRRVITTPDFLFSTVDFGNTLADRSFTAGNFVTANVATNLAGPGNIEPNMVIRFNRVGPLLGNFYDPFTVNNGLTEATSFTNFIWGTFEGGSGPPIIYPQGSSIQDLESQVLFQITTASLPNGTVGVPYAAQLELEGGQAPYVWAPAAGSAPLPGGLILTAGGLVSGTPTASGDFLFTVTVSDTASHATSRTIQITIIP